MGPGDLVRGPKRGLTSAKQSGQPLQGRDEGGFSVQFPGVLIRCSPPGSAWGFLNGRHLARFRRPGLCHRTRPNRANQPVLSEVETPLAQGKRIGARSPAKAGGYTSTGRARSGSGVAAITGVCYWAL